MSKYFEIIAITMVCGLIAIGTTGCRGGVGQYLPWSKGCCGQCTDSGCSTCGDTAGYAPQSYASDAGYSSSPGYSTGGGTINSPAPSSFGAGSETRSYSGSGTR